ncbi:root phototropism protein 3-like isoform X1 [Populus nigra]|nr:root phototropism protein 3-like isoform X1 [Populus nigra]
MGSRSFDGGKATVSGSKHNKCVILPANESVVAEALEKRNQNWTVHDRVANDLIIQVGDSSFQLHKLAMVSKSEYLNRLVFQRRSNGAKDTLPKIQIDNFPGGSEIFELVVKFCYGCKVDLTASNIAPVHCAAHFLEMSDDLEQGNLISKTEAFLSFVLFSAWKDIFRILKSCESISLWAMKLQILQRCSDAIAWKACIDPNLFTLSEDDAISLNVLENDAENLKHKGVAENWWFEDVSCLRIDHFVEVIKSIKRKGVRSELVGSCVAYWTAKWISGPDNLPKHLTHHLLRVTTESLVRILPEEENSVSANFLLHFLKLGIMTRINSELLNEVEKRIALKLENCRVSDLLIKNYGNDDTVYDVGTVSRVVEAYASSMLKNPTPKLLVVGKLVDGYLAQVSRDAKLSVEQFRSLAEALPNDARYCHDNLYTAIDAYLKAHPRLTEEERISVCTAMAYHKLSQEGLKHATRNDRLPVNITTRLILLEQVNMARSLTSVGSNYQRTKTQAIIRVNRCVENEWMTSRNEIKMMRKEVENMKMQLSELQICKMQIQRRAKGCLISKRIFGSEHSVA